ncbi:actin-like ATPase domain-containing protein [Aspergillus ellipticus CBS 707.79]|uniref:Actin-like ATPase domain-containing protein n=1 Tax=Aspergillus ellipticus CBS 707.79 TaxID=1448320 RepID=A0A319ETU5_9EURO|nr:actin-like ATPase domain-containing protein [Aspergillus ellipticus CBS 707.79]
MGETSTMRSIVTAVDFGTTFSGVAWAQTRNPDAHYIINQWPQSISGSCDGMASEKVPTEIAYQYTPPEPRYLWGFQIPETMPRMQWIKLGLVPDQKSGIGSRLAMEYKDPRRASVPYHSSDEEVVTDYLRCLREHTIEILRSKIGISIDNTPLEFVITVPAVWPDQAKVKTLNCAEKAGFGETSKIRIISEPEAAAIHSMSASSPHGLEVDDTIVICDAGGGTVDLITFTIVQLVPNLRLKEEAPGDGKLCGGTFVNRRFEEFLKERLSSNPGWELDTFNNAMHRFETVTKRTFSGNTDDDFMFPVPGIADTKELGVHRGRLQASGDTMKELFAPVLDEIHDLVKQQVETSSKNVRAIFLVGGFGQSPYLRKFLRDAFSPGIQVIAPVDGWTAVVRGALAKTLGDIAPLVVRSCIDSRKARKNYGMVKSVLFDANLHDANKKYWFEFDGEYRINVMHWFICKGDEIKETEPIKTEWWQRILVKYGPVNSIRTKLYELDTALDEQPPMYVNRHMKQHAILNPTLSHLEKELMPTKKIRDGEI